MSQEEKQIEGNTLVGRGAYAAMTLSRECGKSNSVVEKRIGSWAGRKNQRSLWEGERRDRGDLGCRPCSAR